MVAPYQVVEVSKSYVRIQGGKSNINAKTRLYDISRGSQLAATISIPGSISYSSNLPSRTLHCKRSTFISNNESSQSKISKFNYTSDISQCNMPGGNSVNNVNTRLSHITTSLTTKVTPVPVMGVEDSNTDLQKLILENIDLKRRISLFISLIKNPIRLNSVLSRLKEKSCTI